jgi:BirA family biotin operon repressor/biotin-[acetyl-CoA-carboxylase] ligase
LLGPLGAGLGVTFADRFSAFGDLLRQAGYTIIADREGRYAFTSAPDSLYAAEIIYGLRTSIIGRTVYAYKTVQSTNSVASHLAEVKAPEGTIVVAESQTKGRGRLGRPWFSPGHRRRAGALVAPGSLRPAKGFIFR